MKQRFDLSSFVEFRQNDKVKKDIFKGKHFNIAIICLDKGYEIPPHDEPYDAFFYVISGRGLFTVGDKQWDAVPGSMVFVPAGPRGIKSLERLTHLGIQDPH